MNQQSSPFHSSESTQTYLNGVTHSLSNIWNNAQDVVNYLIKVVKEQVQQREALEARAAQLEREKNGLLLQFGTLESQFRAKEEQNRLVTATCTQLKARAENAEAGWNQCHQYITKARSAFHELENSKKKASVDAENYKTSLLEAEQRVAQMSLELENLRVKSATLEHKGSAGTVFATLTEEQKKQMAMAMKKELDGRTQKLTSNVKMAVESINKSLTAYRSRIKELEVELEEAKRTDAPAPPPDTTQNQAIQFIFTSLNSSTKNLGQDSDPVAPPTSDTQSLGQDSVPAPSSPSPSPSIPVIATFEPPTPITINPARRSASPDVIDLTDSPARKRPRIDTVVPASIS